MSSTRLLEVKHLQTHFHTGEGVMRAVDDVSFHLDRGETLGIVGESGCGKSITAKSIMQTLPRPAGRIAGGEILYHKDEGRPPIDIAQQDHRGETMRGIRGSEIAMIFQEPMTSLNPVYTIGEQIIEIVRVHTGAGPKEALERAVEMLDRVGIPDPSHRAHQYPHEFSGGMRQRAMIAMALSCNPKLLIADEPTTALDVTVEAQIINLLAELQQQMGMSIIMITHDLGVIAGVASPVAVMYSGWLVESGTVDEIFHESRHPYTQGLLQSIPRIGEEKRLVPIRGTVPSIKLLSEGWCYFAPRCPQAMDVCGVKAPYDTETDDQHFVKCWLHAREEART